MMHLCAPAHVGGLERVVQGLSSGQLRRGHRVAVVAVVEPNTDTSAFMDPMQEAGVECIRVEVAGRAYLTELREVGRLLSSWRPDVLHTHGYRSDLLHGGHARRKGVATVTTLHGSSRMGGFSRVFEWIQEWALRRFDAVIAVSAPLVEVLRGRGVTADRIHEVPNAWTPPDRMIPRDEARRTLDAPMDRLLVGWVGRLIPIKGCDIFLEALARMEYDCGWVARIVGDGPERPRLEAMVRELGLSERVRFLGAVPDAARLFSALDLFVLSSRSEGTPMVLLEAMGAGVPVLATTVGGVPDLVEGGRSGWLVPPEAPADLALAIAEALASREARSARAERGSTHVRSKYDFDTWIRRHEEVYRSALDARLGNG